MPHIASRFTLEPEADSHPLWSSDSSRVLYSSVRGKDRRLVERPANGLGCEAMFQTRLNYISGVQRHQERWALCAVLS